jgi:hypothetical protein
MVTHIEAAPRLPGWLIAALVVAGVALGLWQVGVFDRSSAGRNGANAPVVPGQSRALAGTAAADATAAESASAYDRGNRSADGRPIKSIELPRGDPDPEVRAESDALRAALAAEQASD